MAAKKSEPNRRVDIARDIALRTGIDEAVIERRVRNVDAEIRSDPLLGPLFADRFTDRETQIAKPCDCRSPMTRPTGHDHLREARPSPREAGAPAYLQMH
jgi:hemoglobin